MKKEGRLAAQRILSNMRHKIEEDYVNKIKTEEISQELIETDFGSIIFQDDLCVVRAIRKPDGLHVYVHGKYNEVEKLPLGYMSGSNLMVYKYGEG